MARWLARVVVVLVVVTGVGWMALHSAVPANAAVSCDSHAPVDNLKHLPVELPAYLQSNDIYTFNCELGQGNDSSAVYWLQWSLNQCYGRKLALDSDYGPATAAAVRYAQSKSGDPDVDGVYGPQTEAYMQWGNDDTASGSCARLPAPPPVIV